MLIGIKTIFHIDFKVKLTVEQYGRRLKELLEDTQYELLQRMICDPDKIIRTTGME